MLRAILAWVAWVVVAVEEKEAEELEEPEEEWAVVVADVAVGVVKEKVL
jgi:hypothetical protein